MAIDVHLKLDAGKAQGLWAALASLESLQTLDVGLFVARPSALRRTVFPHDCFFAAVALLTQIRYGSACTSVCDDHGAMPSTL